MDRLLAFFMLIAIILFAGLIICLFYVGINEIGVKETSSTITRVGDKGIVPAHVTQTYIMVGKVMVPHTIHHPESYWISFEIEGQQCKESLNHDFFLQLKRGDKISVGYGKGRFNQSVVPKRISRIEQ